VTFRPQILQDFFLSTDATCPRFAYFSDGLYYYRWMDHHMWTKGPVLLDAFRLRAGATPLLLSLAYGGLVAGLVMRLQREGAHRPMLRRFLLSKLASLSLIAVVLVAFLANEYWRRAF
jgi:hypothetical protein